MMRLSVGPGSIPAGQACNPGRAVAGYLNCISTAARLACGGWFWQGPLPTVPVFGQHRPLGSQRRASVWTGGCIWRGQEGRRQPLAVPLPGMVLPFPFWWCLPMGGGLALWPGLMTLGSAGCPANGRACADMCRCADVQSCSPFPQHSSSLASALWSVVLRTPSRSTATA